MHSIPGRRLIMALFLIFLLLPIYWLVNMSFKTNAEIVSIDDSPAGVTMVVRSTVQIDGVEKPACVAENVRVLVY